MSVVTMPTPQPLCTCGCPIAVHVDGSGPCCGFDNLRRFPGNRFFCNCRKADQRA